MNQKLILFLICILFSYPVNAQKLSFIDKSNKWTFINKYPTVKPKHITTYDSCMYQYEYGDSIIDFNNKQYLLLKIKKESCGVSMGDWLIRADSSGRKIYAKERYTMQSEHLLYDFDLKTGDTFRVDIPDIAWNLKLTEIVSVEDSVQINGDWHRIFYFTHLPGLGGATYYVVEGIGCLTDLFYPFTNFGYYFDHSMRIICFENNNTKPVFSNTIVNYFDNTTSCADTMLNIDALPANENIHIYPQPAHDIAVLLFPRVINHGSLRIINMFGEVLYEESFQQKKRWEIINDGRYKPGIYIYQVINKADSEIFTGRLSFQ